jgi:hypothetical protein
METHCNVQRRLYDYQFSLTQTPAEFEQVHQAFLHTYNTIAHQGLLHEDFDPPIPLLVLGEAKSRMYTPDELLQRLFAQIERLLTLNGLHRLTKEVVEAARDCLIIGLT